MDGIVQAIIVVIVVLLGAGSIFSICRQRDTHR